VQHLFYTLPILVCSFVFNIPRFFELKCVQVEQNVTVLDPETEEEMNLTRVVPQVQPRDLRKDPLYSHYYVLLANSFALGFIPMAVLIILNLCIYRTIAKATQLHNAISSNQRRDHKVSKVGRGRVGQAGSL